MAVNLVLPALRTAIMSVNAAVLANPYVAAAAAIGILAAAMLTYKDASDKARAAKEDFDDSIKDKTGRAAMEAIAVQLKEANNQLADARRKYAELRTIQEAQGVRASNSIIRQAGETGELIKVLEDQVIAYQRQYQEASKQEQQRIRDTKTMNDQTMARAANVEVSDKELNNLKELELARLKEAHAIEEATQAMRDQQLVELNTPSGAGMALPGLGELDLFEIPGLEEEVWEAPTQSAEEYFENLARIREEMLLLAETSATWGMQFGEVMGQIVMGTEGASEAFKSFASSAVDAAFNAATALAIQAAGQTAVGAGPAAAIILPALITAGMGLMKSVFSNIMEFADGGIISGPTVGLMGEYSGARTNPEVVAPLDKLRSMIGGAGGNVVVTGRLDGRDILLSSERSTIDRYRTRGY